MERDPLRLEHNPYLYVNASPTLSTDPTGTCKERPGDPEGTCRVEPGDWLCKIAREHNIYPEKKLVAWNPEFVNPSLIHPGNLVYLYARTELVRPEALPGQSGIPLLDTISGYLEGEMKSSTLGCITWWVEGEEIVYDFALRPPERARFTYRGVGITLSTSPSLADVTDTGYAGFIWGFDPRQPAERPGIPKNIRENTRGIFLDYEGPSIGASVGASASLPPGFLGVFTFGVGGAVLEDSSR